MDSIAALLVHRHKQVLGATALLTIVSLLMFFRMDFNADISSFMTEGSVEGESFAALQAKYETADPINVMLSLPQGETFRTPSRLADVAATRDRLLGLDGVATVAAVVPDVHPLTGAPMTPELVESLPEIAIGQLSASPFADLLVSADGRHTLLMVIPDGDGIDVAKAVKDLEPPAGTELTVSGNPAIYAEIIDILGWFLLAIPPTVILLLLATFYANVGDRRLTALSIVPAIIGAIWTFGVIFGVGRQIDIVTVIVPIFVIVMGSADGLHFVTHFQDVAGRTEDPVERVLSTLRQVGKPMILTTISTSVGFLSLFVADVGPIRDMGLFAAIGISLAGVVSYFSLPAMLTVLDVRGRARPPRLGGSLIRGLQRLVRTRTPAVVLVIGLVTFSALAIPQLEVDSDPLFMFGDDDDVRVAFERTESLFGGATPLVGEFAFDPADVDGSLAAAAESTARLEALPVVRRVVSLASMAPALPPGTVEGVIDGTVELPIGSMVTEDGMRFMLLPEDLSTTGLRQLTDTADNDPTVRSLTGMTIIWDAVANLVLNAQVWSVASALGLVALMLGVTYRRLRPTLVALVPLVLTVGVLLGFIAVSGINLNLITAVASSIVIGVGVDYAIHFVAAIEHAEAAGPGSVHRALASAGRPIIANALGIAVALTALWLSPLRPHHHISMIMWVSMTIAALSSLVVIPALLPRHTVEDASARTG